MVDPTSAGFERHRATWTDMARHAPTSALRRSGAGNGVPRADASVTARVDSALSGDPGSGLPATGTGQGLRQRFRGVCRPRASRDRRSRRTAFAAARTRSTIARNCGIDCPRLRCLLSGGGGGRRRVRGTDEYDPTLRSPLDERDNEPVFALEARAPILVRERGAFIVTSDPDDGDASCGFSHTEHSSRCDRVHQRQRRRHLRAAACLSPRSSMKAQPRSRQ